MRILLCSSKTSFKNASLKNQTEFTNHKKGKSAKPPENQQKMAVLTLKYIYSGYITNSNDIIYIYLTIAN